MNRDASSAGAGRPVRCGLAGQPIQAHHAGQIVAGGSLEEADAPADAEAGRVQPFRGTAVGRAEVVDRGGDVVHDALRAELHDVRLVLEALAALPGLGRSAEIVDRHGVDPGLGEAQGELLEVGMQATDVGKDHQARPERAFGSGRVRRERPCRLGW